jgi:hypothetical protein
MQAPPVTFSFSTSLEGSACSLQSNLKVIACNPRPDHNVDVRPTMRSNEARWPAADLAFFSARKGILHQMIG